VNTIPQQHADGRRRRRLHSDEFKADAVAACQQPGMSMAAVAMRCGVNANLLRRWVRLAETSPAPALARMTTPTASPNSTPPVFLPLQLPAPAAPTATTINVELRRGTTTINVCWPSHAAAECAAWMRELLR
jgi:transposase